MQSTKEHKGENQNIILMQSSSSHKITLKRNQHIRFFLRVCFLTMIAFKITTATLFLASQVTAKEQPLPESTNIFEDTALIRMTSPASSTENRYLMGYILGSQKPLPAILGVDAEEC